MSAPVWAVVLAAGASSRMGEHKLLLPLGGEPLVRRAARSALGGGYDGVLVVLGRDPERVRGALAGLPVRLTENPDYASGMGSSFRAAVRALPPEAEAAAFALADQPLVGPDEHRRLLGAYRAARPPVVGARYGGVTAPPHLFARALFPELEALSEGARPALERHRAEAVTLDFPPEALLDIDTPEDYARAVARLGA